MRLPHIVVIAASTIAVAACNPFHKDPVSEVTRDANVNSRWQASLVTPASLAGAVQIKGYATMQPGHNNVDTDFSLNVSNATPGGVHPWQVHRGQCGADEGVVGSEGNYKAIKVGEDGNGNSKASVAMPTPTSGSYFVTVRASAANPETVVACGNLAPPAQ